MDSRLGIRFLGTRSTHTATTKDIGQFGGSAEALLIQYGDANLLVNCGFSVDSWSEVMLRRLQSKGQKFEGHIFFTDFLWEHILGFPFMLPIHFSTSRVSIHSSESAAKSALLLGHSCSLDFSPFNGIESLRASIHFVEHKGSAQIFDGWIAHGLRLDQQIQKRQVKTAWKLTCPSGQVILVSSGRFSLEDIEQNPSFFEGVDFYIQSLEFQDRLTSRDSDRQCYIDTVTAAMAMKCPNLFVSGFRPDSGERILLDFETMCQKLGEQSGCRVEFSREGKVIYLDKEQQTKAIA
jgi:hypothetical protein